MKYLTLDRTERQALTNALASMPDYLARAFDGLTAPEAAEAGPDGCFGPVEQCWHLADLEREGFGARIRRLLSEVEPRLLDFDGAAVAGVTIARGRWPRVWPRSAQRATRTSRLSAPFVPRTGREEGRKRASVPWRSATSRR